MHAAASAGPIPDPDPGLEHHEPRLTDIDERAAKRVERQVGGMLTLSALCTVAFIVSYLAVSPDASILGIGALNLALGGFLGMALPLIGLAAIQWAKKLMSDREIVDERHDASSTTEDRSRPSGCSTRVPRSRRSPGGRSSAAV